VLGELAIACDRLGEVLRFDAIELAGFDVDGRLNNNRPAATTTPSPRPERSSVGSRVA
jgi:hypothetical protein